MKVSKNFKKQLDSHIVTESMLGEVIYSYNKRAKNMRDQEREYREREREIRRYNRYFSDKYDTCGKYRDKKEHYYSRKACLLGFASPCEMHVVERVGKRRVYEYESEFNSASEKAIYFNCYWDRGKGAEVQFCDILEPHNEYYLYYKIGDQSFHSPIDNPADYNLPIVYISDLETFGLSTDQLLSVQTCEKVYKGLCDGTLKYVNKNEHH